MLGAENSGFFLSFDLTLSDIPGCYDDCFIGVQLGDAAVVRDRGTVAETVRRLREQRDGWGHDVMVGADTSRLGHSATVLIRHPVVSVVARAQTLLEPSAEHAAGKLTGVLVVDE